MNNTKSKFKMNLGYKIANIRKEKGFSQEEVSVCLDYSRGLIAKIETGMNTPSLIFLYRLCILFKCDINDLILSNKEVKPSDFNILQPRI